MSNKITQREAKTRWIYFIVAVILPFPAIFLSTNPDFEILSIIMILVSIPLLYVWSGKMGLFN